MIEANIRVKPHMENEYRGGEWDMNGLSEVKKIIESGKAVLGIELGSTRIKAVLVDQRGSVIETGGFDWENSLIDGVWTYSLKEVWEGIQKCYKNLSERLKERYDVKINKLSANLPI